MKLFTALSVTALMALSVPAVAQDVYRDGVQNSTTPGGMNNGISPGEQRGLDAPRGMTEGRAAAPDYYNNTYDNNANADGVDHRPAPGGMNNHLSPLIQHAD